MLPFLCSPLGFCASLEKRPELDHQVELETLDAVAIRGITAGLPVNQDVGTSISPERDGVYEV